MYKWEVGFSEGVLNSALKKSFIKSIFNILNKGTRYVDLDGKFVGYINALEGPLGIIKFISDHSLDSDDYRYIIIKIIYLDKPVLYFIISSNVLAVHEFMNGLWANSISAYMRRLKETNKSLLED